MLFVEAGIDPSVDGWRAGGQRLREMYSVPAYHSAATEDPPFSWEFSVRHYGGDAQQTRDSKYDA